MPRGSEKGRTFSIYLPFAVARLMTQEANKQKRSVSNTITLALYEWLEQHGYDLESAEQESPGDRHG